MTPFKKALRRLVEKMVGRFYEGPEPPPRIAEEVIAFRRLYPDASVNEWSAFTQRIAENSYRDGFVRGFEWAERDLDSKPKDDPDVLFEQMQHAWAPSDDPDVRLAMMLGDPHDPLANADPEAKAALFDELGARQGEHWRVHVETEPLRHPRGSRKRGR